MSATDSPATPHREPAVPSWIRPLVIPTPFSVGPVNAYLIEDEPVTLVDTGPNYSVARSSLETALAEHGRRLEDVGLILLTHQHYDHLGLAATVQARSGAEVAALEPLVAFARDCRTSIAAEHEYQSRIMEVHGVPDETVRALRQISAAFTRFGASVDVTRPLHDGDVVELGKHRLRGRAPARPQPNRHPVRRGRGAGGVRRRPSDRTHLIEPHDPATPGGGSRSLSTAAGTDFLSGFNGAHVLP
jgi:glyoxylase-like metal-dependent hydrolase (beta-lactamase superfamily II)